MEHNLKDSWKGKILIFTLCFIVLAGLFYWVVAEDWSKTALDVAPVSPAGLIPVDDENRMITSQSFTGEMQRITSFWVRPGRVRTDVSGTVSFRILEGDQVLWEGQRDSSSLKFDEFNIIDIVPALENAKGKHLRLEIDAGGTGVSFQQGNTVSAGKFEVGVQSDETLQVNDRPQEGSLVLGFHGEDELTAHRWIIPGAVVLYLIGLLMFYLAWRHETTGKPNLVGRIVDLVRRYSYLLKTLVARDFKIKYQSSILGVLWSFLNPLLTMTVYLFVFSMIFRSNIENFPVYLLSGIVMFNYFSESTSLGLLSIVGNRTLITKVYMPKYIYPLSKVLSSAVNLIISFIPLFIMMLVTGLPIRKSVLLLPLVLLFQIMFCTGLSLILSTLHVFFRDIQFLWGILVTIWNFLTPIFYPESIIPQQFIHLYHLNPLYQIVYFTRCIIIGGISPTPITYLYCILACGIPLVIGILFFRKNQDRFVLYL